jgi:6-phosphogluconolactonase
MLRKALMLGVALAGIAGGIGCSTSSHYVYAALPAANQIAAYREDPYSGTLTELSGSPYTVGDGTRSLALHPSGQYLYASNPGQGEDDISQFVVQSNGTLIENFPRTPIGPLASLPQLLAMDPAGGFLYVANAASNNISVFSIDSSTGRLTQVNGSPFSVGLSPLALQLTPAGNYLYVSAASDPLGLVVTYSVNAGVLTLAGPPTSTAGINPNGLAIDPKGGYLYVANTGSNSIAIFAIAPAGGGLTQVVNSPLDDIYSNPFALTLDAAGQYLYVANQGSNNVAVYSIDPTTGLPVSLTTSTSTFAFTTESNPSVLAEDPNGGYLFVGNQGSGAGIQAFGVNSGNLNPLFTYKQGNAPLSIVVLK